MANGGFSCDKKTRGLIDVKFCGLAIATLMALPGCLREPPSIPASTSSGSTGGGTTAPISNTPKTVSISWTASKALGVTAGGYKVYVRLNAIPTTATTTPTIIANSGAIHTTSTTMTLAPGRYYVAVSAYSSDGDSPLSTPYILQVP